MKYERITTRKLLAQIESISFTIGRLWATEGQPCGVARCELEDVRTMLRQELLARISRRRRRRGR